MTIRQPIVTIAGHVDHGKTSILDSLRQSVVAEKEAGNITQKISFTLFPIDKVRGKCPLIEKQGLKLDIPGFLFIDTPGHAAFNSLRKRGGNLADLAIVVIDINEGIKPQTAEVLQILKLSKTPFIIALNKVDRVRGWNKVSDDMKESLAMQPAHVKQEFDEKFYTLVGSLSSHGIDADLFFNIEDFSKSVAMVPCSAKTFEGIPELLLMLCGLSQRFLQKQLTLGKDAKGVVLEIKKERAMSYIESILYDGELKVGDKIAIASFDAPIFTTVKAISEILPVSNKFKAADSVSAASGIRMQLKDRVDVLPGMPFTTYSSKERVISEFKKEVGESIKTDKKGIIIKADSLGSLEAMIVLLKQENIKIVKAGIGSISKADVLAGKANLEIDPIDSVILGFNVEIDEDVKETYGVKIFTDEVVYKLIEVLQEFREAKAKEIERQRLMGLATIVKAEILHQYVFRNSSPAVFGVKILGGKIVNNMELISEDGETIGRIKNIQADKKSVDEATEGMEVAISISGSNFDRKIKDKKFLYSNISEKQFKKFKENKDLLSSTEISVLQEIKVVKQKGKEGWGC